VDAIYDGDVEAALAPVDQTLTDVLAGELRAIAVLDDERSEDLPDVPTAKELSHDVEVPVFGGIAAPAGTPPRSWKNWAGLSGPPPARKGSPEPWLERAESPRRSAQEGSLATWMDNLDGYPRRNPAVLDEKNFSDPHPGPLFRLMRLIQPGRLQYAPWPEPGVGGRKIWPSTNTSAPTVMSAST